MRTSRAVLGILATTAVAGAVAGGSPGARSAGPFVGTWTIAPKAGTPWASGGTLTVSAASRSEVIALGPVCDGCGTDRKDGNPVPFGNNGYEDKCIGFDPAVWGEGSTNPTVTAWYVLAFSWPSPKMGGCVSNKTAGSIAFFGNPREFRGFMAARPDGTIFGAWVKDPGSLGFEGASKGSGGTGGGGAGAGGSTKTVAEPVPDHSVLFSSPRDIPQATLAIGLIVVTSSAGDTKGTTIAAEGEVTKTNVIGELIAACWLLGDPDDDLGPAEQLHWCLLVVRSIARSLGRKPSSVVLAAAPRVSLPARIGTGGCRAKRLAFSVRTSNGRITSIKPTRSKVTASSVRYSCSAGGGTLKIRVDGRVKGGLRTKLGQKLDLLVARNKKAPKRSGKLTLSFNW